MKQFCPNCEKDSECIHAAELYECQECGEDFAKYIVPRTNPDYYNHADNSDETSIVVNEPSNSDVSVTKNVLTDIKTDGELKSCPFCGYQKEIDRLETMLKSKDIIIGNQEKRINELAMRLLKGGERGA